LFRPEEIARLYLRALELARQGDRDWQDNYEWMMIEPLRSDDSRSIGRHGAYLNVLHPEPRLRPQAARPGSR
jgi:hypothetical protein